MPHTALMNYYESLPTNGVLAGVSSFFGIVVGGLDPVWTGIALPVILWAAGKGVDVILKLWIERRRER